MTKSLWQYGYTSEWALAKFFSVVFNGHVSQYFNLIGVSGRERDKIEAVFRLEKEAEKRKRALENGDKWREQNTKTEMKSATDLGERLRKGGLNYSFMNNGNNLKLENLPEGYEAAAIFTKNTTHLDYIEYLYKKMHIICEKPLVVVTDENHRADRAQLDKLEKIAEEDLEFIIMDAEHYSAKKAAITFFERIGGMVEEYGRISKIEACTMEKDHTEKGRTRTLLCRGNRTGLLLDMGVHLFGTITNISGEIGEITHAAYDVYPGHEGCEPYDVETYAEVEFKIRGSLFHDNVNGKFTFAKFIGKFKEPLEKDKKEIKVSFRKDYNNGESEERIVTIDLIGGGVKDDKGKIWYSYSEPSPQEYENILKYFYEAIERKQPPRTSIKRGVKNLNAICRTYEKFPVFLESGGIDEGNHIEVYQRG